jgi:hypothetical protein
MHRLRELEWFLRAVCAFLCAPVRAFVFQDGAFEGMGCGASYCVKEAKCGKMNDGDGHAAAAAAAGSYGVAEGGYGGSFGGAAGSYK